MIKVSLEPCESNVSEVFHLSSAVTELIKGDIFLLLAVHAQTSLRRILLSICFKSHLSHVVKQLRQMLLDLSKHTDTFSPALLTLRSRSDCCFLLRRCMNT